jgi:Fe-S cluster biosynthesis and repair protein YggX
VSRQIFCKKTNKLGEGLDRIPYPGPIGERIYAEISKEAWQLWLKHQTLLINENRLNLTDPNTKTFLLNEMEKFLFGSGSDLPSGYTKPT